MTIALSCIMDGELLFKITCLVFMIGHHYIMYVLDIDMPSLKMEDQQ